MPPDSPRRAAEPTPVAGGEHIRPEWVEAAAMAIADDVLDGAWPNLGAVTRETFRRRADAALAAVVPAIQAQALRDAADSVYGDERAEGPHSHPLSIADWLRDRALRAERGELP